MSKKRTQANQNIYDISTQYHGNLDAVGDILMANPNVLPGITTPMVANMLLEVSDTPKDKAIRTQILRRDIVPAGGDDYVLEEWSGNLSAAGADDVTCVAIGANGDVWYGTKTSGLWRYNMHTGVSTQWTTSGTTLPSNYIQALCYESDDNAISVGTNSSGLARYLIGSNTWQTVVNTGSGLAGNGVRAILKYNDRYYVATNAGVSIGDAGSVYATLTTVDTGDGLSSNNTAGMAWWNGRLVVATVAGVDSIAADGSDVQPISTLTYAAHLLVDTSNRLWISSSNDGLAIMDGVNELLYTSSDRLQSNTLGPLVIDRLGVVYVADKLTSSNTLSVVRWPDWQLLTNTTTSLPNATCFGLAVDHQDNIWLAMNGRLVRWNRNPMINA